MELGEAVLEAQLPPPAWAAPAPAVFAGAGASQLLPPTPGYGPHGVPLAQRAQHAQHATPPAPVLRWTRYVLPSSLSQSSAGSDNLWTPNGSGSLPRTPPGAPRARLRGVSLTKVTESQGLRVSLVLLWRIWRG